MPESQNEIFQQAVKAALARSDEFSEQQHADLPPNGLYALCVSDAGWENKPDGTKSIALTQLNGTKGKNILAILTAYEHGLLQGGTVIREANELGVESFTVMSRETPLWQMIDKQNPYVINVSGDVYQGKTRPDAKSKWK